MRAYDTLFIHCLHIHPSYDMHEIATLQLALTDLT